MLISLAALYDKKNLLGYYPYLQMIEYFRLNIEYSIVNPGLSGLGLRH